MAFPFPKVEDIRESRPDISPEDAARALDALRALQQTEAVTVYMRPFAQSASGRRLWNVWSELGRERYDLPEWAARWLEGGEAQP